MPAGGFGNLIALPLQVRARKQGNARFVDSDLHPLEDQWAFLSALALISRATAERVVAEAEARGRVVGVRMPVQDDDADEPTNDAAEPGSLADFFRRSPLAKTIADREISPDAFERDRQPPRDIDLSDIDPAKLNDTTS